MPAESKAQYRLMQAMLHGASPKAKGKGKRKKVPKRVAKEYVDATPSPGALPERVGKKK